MHLLEQCSLNFKNLDRSWIHWSGTYQKHQAIASPCSAQEILRKSCRSKLLCLGSLPTTAFSIVWCEWWQKDLITAIILLFQINMLSLFNHLKCWEYCLHFHGYTHNVFLADVFCLLQVFGVELGVHTQLRIEPFRYDWSYMERNGKQSDLRG